MYQIYEDEISTECSTHGIKCAQSFVGYPEEERLLGRPRRRWENN
jgi:hypothetical protein